MPRPTVITVFTPGTLLGNLVIHRLLGRGGMGEVYEAEQVSLRRRVAVKRIADHLVEHPDALKRFEREAQTIAKLQCDQVVAVFEFGRYVDGANREHVLLVLELVPGGLSLRRVLAEGSLSWPQATCVVRQAAEGLARAEELAIVHRDIKPDNLLLTDRGVVKLTDFGLAKALDSTAISLSGSLLGTPAYLAPEVCAGGPADARSDLYSLGCTWFHLLTGRTPFVADSTLAMLQCQQRDLPPEVRDLAQQVPPAVADLVARLLAKSPEQRFAHARDLVTAIDGLAATGLVVPRLVPDLAAPLLLREAAGPATAAPPAAGTPATRPTAQDPTVPMGPPAAVGPGNTAHRASAPTVSTEPAQPGHGWTAAKPEPKQRLGWKWWAFIIVVLVNGVWWSRIDRHQRRAEPITASTASDPTRVSTLPPKSGEEPTFPAVDPGPTPERSITTASATPIALDDPDAVAAAVDAALAEQRLGDAQRFSEILASRGHHADKTAAVASAIRTAERGWNEILDEAETATEGEGWIAAAARIREVPDDRLHATRAIADRRERLATSVRRGAASAFAEARLKAQDLLDQGNPVMARHHLMIARPLAALAGFEQLRDYDRLFRRMSDADRRR